MSIRHHNYDLFECCGGTISYGACNDHRVAFARQPLPSLTRERCHISFPTAVCVDALYSAVMCAESYCVLVATMKINELSQETASFYKERLLFFKHSFPDDALNR